MGYTHYWDNVNATDEQWTQVKEDAKRILAVTEVPIQHDYEDAKAPQVDDEYIWFNGVDDDGHETFAIPKTGSGFDFCKTAYKPYDEVCVAMLIMMVQNVPDFSWRSDGEYDDFIAGGALYERATGNTLHGQLLKEDES